MTTSQGAPPSKSYSDGLAGQCHRSEETDGLSLIKYLPPGVREEAQRHGP
jgi:hypothetical protein